MALMDLSRFKTITPNAETILKSRYYLKDQEGKVIEDWEGLCDRVATCVADVETNEKDREQWKEIFYNMMHDLEFLPNTPTLINAGKKSGLSACYVCPLENSVKDIFYTLKKTAVIHKSGGGTGFNFSKINLPPMQSIREPFAFDYNPCVYLPDNHPDYQIFLQEEFKHLKKISSRDGYKQMVLLLDNFNTEVYTMGDQLESLFDFYPIVTGQPKIIDYSEVRPKDSIVSSTKGVASGPVSFMKVLDAAIDFAFNKMTPITCIKLFDACTEAVKQGGARRGANMGIVNMDSPFIWDFISCKENQNEINNFNLSVGVTSSALFEEKDFSMKDYSITPPAVIPDKFCDGKKLFNEIVHRAWSNGEPGIIFLDKINQTSTIPSHEIESSNPC